LPGSPVERGDVLAAPGEQHRLTAGPNVFVPRVDDGFERVISCRPGDEPLMSAIPVDGLGNLPSA
jgi:hypothetical protein